ncbi:unnamed protein product [Hydatigera taeniaeformis]|uniref:Ig-like domain-containing protein n=1 Tax=Hydatigena taeniaeformis TaxID=6205 RepID=A0A0R3X808_HYDTA|nr:unnamed protein product [Hydatigera taeniaeformis]
MQDYHQYRRFNFHYYHHHHHLLFLLLVLSMLHLTSTAPTSISGASTELLQLQGPRNTSVERGATARLRCHLLVAATTTTTTPSHTPHSIATLRFIPWRASANQRLSVQWNIDGFGFTNESLVESYGERYFMPGPLNEGECLSGHLFGMG